MPYGLAPSAGGIGFESSAGGQLAAGSQDDCEPFPVLRDGMIRVVGREFNGLMDSPCFQQGEMSCLSCHVMHQAKDDERPRHDWTDDQLLPKMRGNEACLSCHADLKSAPALAGTPTMSRLPRGVAVTTATCRTPRMVF